MLAPAQQPAGQTQQPLSTSLMRVALVVLAGLAAYRFFILAVYPIYNGERTADFMVFYTAAQYHADGLTLYPIPGKPTTYLYPPTLALLLAPFVGQFDLLYFVFMGLALLAVAISLVLLALFTEHGRRPLLVVLGIVALAAWPVHLLLRQGQVDSFTLVLMALALLLAWRGRIHWSALSLGAAISLKLTPGVLVLYFLWKRRFRLAVESLVASVAIVVVGGLLAAPGDLLVWVTRVLPRISSEGHAYWYNQSIHALYLRLFATNIYTEPVVNLGIGAVTLLTAVTSAILLGALFLCVNRQWPASGALLLVEGGAFMAFETLASSLSWQMHHVWQLVPIAGLCLWAQEERRAPGWLVPALGIACLGFISGPYEPPLEYGRFAWGWGTIAMSHTLAAAFLLFSLCLVVARRAHRPAQQPVLSTPGRPRPAEPAVAVPRPVEAG